MIDLANDRCDQRRPYFAAERHSMSHQHAPLVLDAPGDAEAIPLVQVDTNYPIQFHGP